VYKIFGLLETRALCTARLVSKSFKRVASSFIHSVTLAPEDLCTRPSSSVVARTGTGPNLKESFPNLKHVAVWVDLREDDLSLLAASDVPDAITHLYLVLARPSRLPAPQQHPLPLLSSLVSLSVYNNDRNPRIDFPTTLKELHLDNPICYPHADPLSCLTQLTSLRVPLCGYGFTPFGALSALTRLEKLEIACESSLIPRIAELALLTHLCLSMTSGAHNWGANLNLGLLTRLGKLEHLGVRGVPMDPMLQLANMGMMSTIKSLDLGLSRGVEPVTLAPAFMAPLSRLTALALEGNRLDVSFVSGFKLEELQSLTLSGAYELDPQGVANLARATRLTHLGLCSKDDSHVPNDIFPALSRMSRLQSLSLEVPKLQATPCFETMKHLTALTRLQWVGGPLTNVDVQVCLGLRELRELGLFPVGRPPGDGVTVATFVALAKLPGLTKLEVKGNLGSEPFHEYVEGPHVGLNEAREARGWPAIELDVVHESFPGLYTISLSAAHVWIVP
jgi:hypothetical protein